MFTDFPKIMVWHFHVPETQMSGMINFLHHRQNSRLIGFRDIKNHGIENLFFTVTIFNFLTRIAKFRCTIVLSEFQLNQCPDSLHGINRIRSFKSKPETFFLVETQLRNIRPHIFFPRNNTDSVCIIKCFFRIHHDRRHKITSSVQCASHLLVSYLRRIKSDTISSRLSADAESSSLVADTSSEVAELDCTTPFTCSTASEICFTDSACLSEI